MVKKNFMTKMWLFCSGSFLMCNTQRIINNIINEAQLPAHKNEKWQWCLHGEKIVRKWATWNKWFNHRVLNLYN